MAGASEFGVATYHMPCVFWEPAVMVIHAALCAQRTQLLARGAPCVLLGDFNFKPGDAAYRLITQGNLDESDAHYPVPPAWEPWRPVLEKPMHSAYAALGGEPAYTNHTVSGMNPAPFTDTLDYIFFSDGHWEPVSCLPTPPSTELIEQCKAPQPSSKDAAETATPVGEIAAALRAAGQPFCPNPFEPSDHLLIAATLNLTAADGSVAASKTRQRKSSSAAGRTRRPSNPVRRPAVRARSPSTSPPPRRRASGRRA